MSSALHCAERNRRLFPTPPFPPDNDPQHRINSELVGSSGHLLTITCHIAKQSLCKSRSKLSVSRCTLSPSCPCAPASCPCLLKREASASHCVSPPKSNPPNLFSRNKRSSWPCPYNIAYRTRCTDLLAAHRRVTGRPRRRTLVASPVTTTRLLRRLLEFRTLHPSRCTTQISDTSSIEHRGWLGEEALIWRLYPLEM